MEVSDLALEECIRAYDREIARKNSLESKATALLNTSAIVISILNSFIAFIIAGIVTFNNSAILIVLNIIATFLIAFSIRWSLDVLKVKKQFVPFDVKNPNSFMKKLNEKEDDLANKLLKRYLFIISEIHKFNNTKVNSLEVSRKFLVFGIIMSFVGLLATIILNIGV